MFDALKAALVAILRILWPFCNRNTREIIGTAAAVLAAVVAIVQALPQDGPVLPPAPAGEVQDVPTLAPDAWTDPKVEPANPLPPLSLRGMTFLPGGQAGFALQMHRRAVAPSALETAGLVVSAVLPVGCSGAQRQAWSDAGTALGRCLAGCGLTAADDLVTTWAAGESVDAAAVGWDALPCVVGCATKAGGVLIAELRGVGDSVGATSTLATRSAAMLATPDDPLEAACGPRTDRPRCVIVLRR